MGRKTEARGIVLAGTEQNVDKIGEYLIKRLVGEGGMGKVYEAEERLSRRRVALKVLRPELTRNEEGRRLFLNEMQILAHLEHPNLVRSLASMEIDGQLVLVLEYLRGRTLRQELTRRGSLAWQDALEHVVAIAEALTVAHEQEPAIVHRDLKPENVMLTVDGSDSPDDAAVSGLKVMDFGIAKVLEGVHGTNTQSIGTLQYMSPEQIDARTIDPRSDLYSLGLMFYETLSGAPPFSSPSPRELLNMQCTAAPPPLTDDVRAGLPRGVEELLFAMLEKAAQDRPPSAREVATRLSLFRAAGAAPARRESRPSRSRVAASPSSTEPRSSTAPGTPRAKRSGDTLGSFSSDDDGEETAARNGDPRKSSTGDERAKDRKPRTDTVALVQGASQKAREVPTWLALVAIGALSVACGLATYVVRLKTAGGADAPPVTTASRLPSP